MEKKRYAEVAVAGPLRRTFVYEIPPSLDRLDPGQRIVVPFGSTKAVGFYLRPADPQPDLRTKEPAETIDESTLFSQELFKLCHWMADYYFANPADCLAAALPSLLKKRHRAVLVWGEAPPPKAPHWIAPLVKPGRPVSREVVKMIKREQRGLLTRLQQQGVIVAMIPMRRASGRQRTVGYRIADADRWENYFQRERRVRPDFFDGTRTRRELLQAGWTDYTLRQAVRDGLLEPVYAERLPELLKSIHAREELSNLTPTDEQAAVIKQIQGTLGQGFAPMLLHGVTGSGKTLVYCHVCRTVLERGQSVLVLTPEIALAGTTLAYFRGFFPDQITIIHSAMTERERLESFNGIRQGRYRIVIGPRSAIFAPLPSPGLIIVDEEHDPSYKQDDPSPRFHGRDAAIMRAKFNDIPVLLGSATPSLESYHRARKGQYRLLRLTRRPGGAVLPQVRVVDMRTERVQGDLPFLSYPLKKDVQARLKRGEQVILYLNRRGHSPMLKCSQCGYVPYCPHCRIKLTYHKTGRRLTCHYCGFVETEYETCRSCGAARFWYLGAGTQKVEEAVPRLFDEAAPVRFDSDAVAGRTKAYQVLKAFADKKYNLLLGTQMVTKGLDLPGVTLVGVLAADLGLDLPDFRAAERTFAQLTQVAGRSGRSAQPGEV
ncbi:MAG: primosomal protein N', partial [Candidatus Zixiibacteriota bacterium]